MKEFNDYDIKYPGLILSIMKYFSISPGINKKSVLDFCTAHFKVPEGQDMIQPDIVIKICDILCSMRMMSCIMHGTGLGVDKNYATAFKNTDPSKDAFYSDYFNSVVYGFEYIYRIYKPRVIPLIAYKEDLQFMGTCFRIRGGLATAKHCLSDGDQIAIKGYSADFLNKCEVRVSSNQDIDLAFIFTKEEDLFNTSDPNVLDEIIVMGYPKVPWFVNFCTVEKATISAMATMRMTATRGAIAAKEKMYYPRDCPDLLLITARIRGGNSGGPLINKYGMVVGVAVGTPAGEGNSDDDIGYGMGYPIDVLYDIITNGEDYHACFVDFPEE